MKTISIVVACLFAISFTFVNAQNIEWCGFDTIHAEMQQNNPNYLQDIQQSDLLIKNWIDNFINNNNNNNQIQNIFPPATYVIPVVVHVIYPSGNPNYPTNISYAQIQSQIDALNAAFAKQYGTGYNNGQGHTPYAVNTEIQFCLAQQTPQCLNNGNGWTNNSEPGVMRWPANNYSDYNIPLGQVGEQALYNLTHNTPCKFQFSEYLNIWIVESIGGNTIAGYGMFPVPTPPYIDGIVMRADVFGDNTIPGNNFNLTPQLNQGKILTHEAGHYLNLWHTHQSGCNGMNDPGQQDPCDLNGDRVCDTPPSTFIGYSCIGQQYNTCAETTTATGGNINDILEAYMSYSDDNCMNTFTDMQKLRMWAAINLYRGNLVTQQNHIQTGLLGPQGCLPAQVLAGIYPSNMSPCINTTVTRTEVCH